jgi:hypothetical protein
MTDTPTHELPRRVALDRRKPFAAWVLAACLAARSVARRCTHIELAQVAARHILVHHLRERLTIFPAVHWFGHDRDVGLEDVLVVVPEAIDQHFHHPGAGVQRAVRPVNHAYARQSDPESKV